MYIVCVHCDVVIHNHIKEYKKLLDILDFFLYFKLDKAPKNQNLPSYSTLTEKNLGLTKYELLTT